MNDNNNEPIEKIIAKAIEQRYGGPDDKSEPDGRNPADRSVYHIDEGVYYSQHQADSAYRKTEQLGATDPQRNGSTAPRYAPVAQQPQPTEGERTRQQHSSSDTGKPKKKKNVKKSSGGTKSKKAASKKRTSGKDTAKRVKTKTAEQSGARNRKAPTRSDGTRRVRTKMNDFDDEIYEAEFPVEEEPPRKKRHPIRTFFKLLLVLILVLFAAYSAIMLHYINMVDIQQEGDRIAAPDNLFDSGGVRNILLIGSDGRSENDRGRADTVILLSIDWKDRTMTLTSFMRDSYVDIPGHGYNKLNAAYRWGGAELLMDTLQVNFRVPIDDYICVDFQSFADIVDAVGGVELTVSTDEAVAMQAPMGEVNKLNGLPKGTDYLYEGGKYLMNGNQALAYSRIRYVGNADFQRTERQREVIQKIFAKAKGLGIKDLNTFASTCAESVTTNMSKGDMYLLSLQMIYFASFDTEELRIPIENGYRGATVDGQSVLEIDFDKNIDEIENKIYD